MNVANRATYLKDTWELKEYGQVIRIHHIPEEKCSLPYGFLDALWAFVSLGCPTQNPVHEPLPATIRLTQGVGKGGLSLSHLGGGKEAGLLGLRWSSGA